MTALAPIGFVLLTTVSAALFAYYFMWHPVSDAVRKRVDASLKIMAARARENREATLEKHKWLAVAERFFTLGMPRKWGLTVPPLTLVIAGLGLGAAVWFLCHSVFDMRPWASAPLAAFVMWFGPHILCDLEQGRADRRFIDLFPDAIDMIVRMMRAGLPVSAAIRTVGQEAPSPISEVFTSLANQIDIGIPFDDALGIGSDRIGLPDFSFFAAAVSLQHSTGGNLVTTLEILGEIIRKRRVVRMKAHAATAEVSLTAYILGSMPFLTLGALLFSSPHYLSPLFDDPRGTFMLAVSAGMLLTAFFVMRQMIRSVVTE